jgi:hydroxymethylpyrimidine pyrophosphatase-like HAD family hydrolase
VRLVATDLDGTLLGSGGVLSDRTRAVLRDVVAAGVDLVVVTARPPRYLDSLGLRGVAVCANGAILYDLSTRQVTERWPLAGEVARRVAAAIGTACPDVGFAVETGRHLAFEPAYARDFRGDRRVAAADRAELWRLGDPIVKLLAWSPAHTADLLLAAAREAVGDVAECTHSGGSGLVEISAAGVTKVAALARLCAARGISAADVVAFGDMPNDLAMLAWAGRGFAIETGHPTLLATPGLHRAPGPAEDGVATVLSSLLAAPSGGADQRWVGSWSGPGTG